jgi:hypothetical protein
VTLVDAGFTIAVATLKLKWQRAGGGSVTGVDRKDLDCWRRNYKMPYCKLKISQGETRHWKISYEWRQLVGKLADGIQYRVSIKVESA